MTWFKVLISENSLKVQWLGLHAFIAKGWVQSLVGELGFHKLWGVAKKKIKNKTLILILLLLVSLNYLQDGFNSFNLKRLKKTVNLYFIASHKKQSRIRNIKDSITYFVGGPILNFHILIIWEILVWTLSFWGGGRHCSMQESVSWSGIKSTLSAGEAWSLKYWTAREVPEAVSF